MSPSEPILRYDCTAKVWAKEMAVTPDGYFMRFSDHQRIVAALEARERKLRGALDELWHMFKLVSWETSDMADLIVQPEALRELKEKLRAALAGKVAQE